MNTCNLWLTHVRSTTLTFPGSEHQVGLFAWKHFEPNEFVGCYAGELVTDPAARRKLLKSENEYLMGIFDQKGQEIGIVDPSKTPGRFNFVRYVNHSKEAKNCEFIQIETDVPYIELYTLTAVERGQEFFCDYGSQYWKNRKPPNENTSTSDK
jgi:SET domain-containing protein